MRGQACLCGHHFPDWLAESEIECKELADEKLGFGEIAEQGAHQCLGCVSQALEKWTRRLSK